MQCMKSQNLQRVSCWSLLGRKMSSVQPLSPYLQGNPIKPTIFSSAWLGASTKVCLQILQLLSCCVFLFSRLVSGKQFWDSLAWEAVEVALPALGDRGGDEATALEASQQGQQVLVLHKATHLRRNSCEVILNCIVYLCAFDTIPVQFFIRNQKIPLHKIYVKQGCLAMWLYCDKLHHLHELYKLLSVGMILHN